MKKLLAILFTAFVFAQCSSPEKKEEKARETYLVSEELQRYAVTDLDSVWSVKVTLRSEDSAIVQYNVDLVEGGVTFSDSLVFNLPAAQDVNGRIIFTDCDTKQNPNPTLSSKIKRLE